MNPLLLFLFILGAASGADLPRRTDAGLCEIFLASGFAQSEVHTGKDLMVFSDGKPLDMGIEQIHVLTGINEAIDFLKGSYAEWVEQLRPNPFHPSAGKIAYATPLGITIWEQRDFEYWISLQNLIDWNSPREVQLLLAHLISDEPLPGVSVQMQTRLKNSYIAHLEATDRREEIAFRYSQYRIPEDPLPPAGIDAKVPEAFRTLPVERQKLLLPLLAEIAKLRVFDETGEKIRNQFPSLNIEFAENGEIETYLDAMWIGRMILREPLLRRLWIDKNQEPLQEETVFLLAAFPEFTPFWPLVQNWGIAFRHYRLNLTNGFYPMRVGPLNREGDSLFLDLRHRFNIVQGSRTEASYIKILFKGDRTRLTQQLKTEWSQFLAAMGMVDQPAPELQDEEPLLALKPQRGFRRFNLLAFYFFLSYKYPLKVAR